MILGWPLPARGSGAVRLPVKLIVAGCVLMGACLLRDGRADSQTAKGNGNASHIRVGPSEPVTSIRVGAKLLGDGGLLEVAAGDYYGEAVVWTQTDVIIRAVGGRARLFSAGETVEGKAIWVTRGDNITVENFDFFGAAVPEGNGAGIRHEKGRLVVRSCGFFRNQIGLMTSNDASAELSVENSEFAGNTSRGGIGHQLYVGALGKLSITGSYFHHGRVGHLLKTRAARSYITYNRLTDEDGGRASYELEFPWGGVAYVIGNLIQQSQTSENPKIVSYGAEGYGRWSQNALYLSHNTVVNSASPLGTFVYAHSGPIQVNAVNNLFVGRGFNHFGPHVESVNNLNVELSEFVAPGRGDY